MKWLVNHESPSTPARSLHEGVGLLLTQICRAHRNLVASALDEINVHVGQDHFVYRLAIEDGLTQSQLAEALCVDASTVTKTDRKSTRLNSSHLGISYAVFCLKKKKKINKTKKI